MKYFVPILLAGLALLTGCNKTDHCGCVPPPFEESSWKITSIEGGVAGTIKTLTEDQKNTIITFKENGSFTANNTNTGATINGTVGMQNFQSIYGDRPKITFTPKLPMLDNDYFVLLENPNGKQVWGDNVLDGYRITITAQP